MQILRAKSWVFRHISAAVLAFSFLVSQAANTVISYSTTNSVAIQPQGDFTNANGELVSLTGQTTTQLTFDGVVSSIDSYSFHNCTKLKTLTLPESIKSVGYLAFSNCTALTKPIKNSKIFARLPITQAGAYEIDEGITEIASGAFYNCDKITVMGLPSTLTKIGAGAFVGCSRLLAVEIHPSVISVGECAFWNCNNLVAICAGYEPTHIEANTFASVDKKTCTVYVPSGSAAKYRKAEYWKEFDNIVESGLYGNCTIECVPVKLTSNGSASMKILARGVTGVKAIAFDLTLPSGITASSSNSLVTVSKNSDGTTHVEADLTDNSTKEITLTLKAGSVSSAAIKTIYVRNGVVKTASRHYLSDPHNADLYLGSAPKVTASNGQVTFYGNYSDATAFALLKSAIPSGVSIVNMKKVTAVPSGAVLTLTNPNALILTTTDLGLGNDHNVVVGNVCEKLVVDDSGDFVNTVNFSANEAVYERTMSSRWGTICVPFGLKSDGNVQFYTLASTNLSSSKASLSFTPVSVVEPGVPAVFKKTSAAATKVTIESEDTQVVNSGGENTDDCTSVTGWQLKGTFAAMTIKPSSSAYAGMNIYYIAQDKFWLTTKDLTIPAYRCWFEATSSASGASVRFDIDDDLTSLDVIESEDGDVEFTMDLMGRQLNGNQPLNGLKIRNGKVIFE